MDINGRLTNFKFINNEVGYGIIATGEWEKRGVKFFEAPIFSYLHAFSRICAITCFSCYKPIGTLVENLNHILKLDGKFLKDEEKDELDHYLTNITNASEFSYITCNQGCSNLFCSKECLEVSSGAHTLFCHSMDKREKSLWSIFERYSLKHHENFHFAGNIYLEIIHKELNTGDMDSVLQKLGEFYTRRWDQLAEDNSRGDRRFVAEESFNLLSGALERFRKMLFERNERAAKKLFSIEFYLDLLGMMDLVCVDIEIPNPLNTLIQEIYSSENGKRILENIEDGLLTVSTIVKGTEIDRESLYKSIESCDLFPEIMGLGIFNTLSKMNHSCSPNIEIEYSLNKIANIVLLEDVKENQELLISYIDEDDVYKNRQETLLKNYGFLCKCAKCLKEGSASL